MSGKAGRTSLERFDGTYVISSPLPARGRSSWNLPSPRAAESFHQRGGLYLLFGGGFLFLGKSRKSSLLI